MEEFYNSIAPLMYITNFLSLSCFKMNARHNKLRVSYPNLIFNVIVAGSFFGCFIYSTGNNAKDLDDSISEATDMFELYSAIIGQTTAILVICVNNKKFIAFFHRLNIVDKRILLIEGLGERITTEYNKKFVIYGVSLVAIEFLMTFIPDYLFFIENETTIYLVTSYYPIITGGLFKVQLATLIYLLWKRFSVVNRILKKLKSKMGDDVSGEKRNSPRLVKTENSYSELLATIHNIFNELCDLLSLINYLYGLQLLLAMGSAFAICARQFHSAYDTMRYMNVDLPGVDAYFSCQWAFVQVLEIFIIIIFAEKTHHEVGKTVFYIHALFHVKPKGKGLKVEVRDFGLHLAQKNIKFHVCGFFDVDFNLITVMFAAITSYIVIIIQSEIAKESITNENTTYHYR